MFRFLGICFGTLVRLFCSQNELERALAVSARIHGEKGSQTLFVLNRVCIIKGVIGKFDEADSAIGQAVDGVKESFFNEGLYAWTLENLALLREAEKRNDDAAKIYAEAVSAHERICGFPSYEAAEALYDQSGCLYGWEKWLQRRRLFDEPSA